MVGEELDGEEAFRSVWNPNKKITFSLSVHPVEWEGHCVTPHQQSRLWLFWREALCPKENWLWKQPVRLKPIILVNRVVLSVLFWRKCIHSDCFHKPVSQFKKCDPTNMMISSSLLLECSSGHWILQPASSLVSWTNYWTMTQRGNWTKLIKTVTGKIWQ